MCVCVCVCACVSYGSVHGIMVNIVGRGHGDALKFSVIYYPIKKVRIQLFSFQL